MRTREPSWLLLVVHCISIQIFQKNALVYHFCHGCLCSNFTFELGIKILFFTVRSITVIWNKFTYKRAAPRGLPLENSLEVGLRQSSCPLPTPSNFRKIWDFSNPKPLNAEVHTTHKYNSLVRCCRISNGITASARRLYNLLFSTDQG